MSLVVTEKLINKAKLKPLNECLDLEYQLSQRMVYRNDFNNGVDSVLVKKNHNPQWNPSNVNEISSEEIDKIFEIHTEKLYL